MRRAQQGSANGQSQTAGADARELASQAMLTISSVSLGRRLRLIMNKNLLKVTLAGWVATVAACGQTEGDKVRCRRALQSPSAGSHQASQSVTVAFIGDQGSGRNARSVLRLIKAEGADLVLHQGDFDYGNDPDGWDSFITEILGADFPYFAAVGNHDTKRWFGPNGYQAKLQKRLSRISGVRCIGELGVRSACHYRGLFFILSGAGTIPKRPDDPDHIAFIRDQLATTEVIWRICAWHKNQDTMQVGSKTSDVGWAPYEECRRGGAIVATGHEHSYSRTHLMDSFETLSIASTSRTLQVAEGKSFAFVSGLGGRGIRDQDRDGRWWAAVYTSDQRANYGALFCRFFLNGEPNKAACYFKDIDCAVPDSFELVSLLGKPDPSEKGRGSDSPAGAVPLRPN